MSLCKNCETYGVMEEDKVIMPCTNCARDAGFMWNGSRCFGSQGDGEVTSREYAEIYFYMVSQREGMTHEKCIELIPEESRVYYLILILMETANL